MNSDIWKKSSGNIVTSVTLFSVAIIVLAASTLIKISTDPVDIANFPAIDIVAAIALIASLIIFRPNIQRLMAEEHWENNLQNMKSIRIGYTYVITALLITLALLILKLHILSMVPFFFVLYGCRKISKGYKRLSNSSTVPYVNLQGYKKLRTSIILFTFAIFIIFGTLFIISLVDTFPPFTSLDSVPENPIDASTEVGQALQEDPIDTSTEVGQAIQENIKAVAEVGQAIQAMSYVMEGFSAIGIMLLTLLRFGLILNAVFALILAIIASFKIINGWRIVKEGGFLPPDEY